VVGDGLWRPGALLAAVGVAGDLLDVLADAALGADGAASQVPQPGDLGGDYGRLQQQRLASGQGLTSA
jgi:hypothetical protein